MSTMSAASPETEPRWNASLRILSVNVGRGRSVARPGKPAKTGIHKLPVEEYVKVSTGGLVGDEIHDTKNHGGVDQAVYVFGAPDYEWWSTELDRELPPGIFGENLTISGLESARANIGDRLRIGSTILEVTAPRIPCVTLATRMEDPAFLKRFRKAERPGLYCRVIQEGEVRSGDSVEYEPYRATTISSTEMFQDFFEPKLDERTLRRHLASPIAIRSRVRKARQLEDALRRLPARPFENVTS